MTGWLIFLGIMLLVAAFPVGASVRYDEDGLLVRLILGPIRLLLYPRPKRAGEVERKPADKSKKAFQKKERSPDGPPAGAPHKDLPKPKMGGSLVDFLPLLDVAVDMLSGLGSRLRVNYLQLRLTMAGDDPCDLAVNYGRAQAAGAALLAQLNRFLVIRKQDVEIQCDFTADEMTILARMDLTITVGRGISLAAVYGVRALTTFLKIKKQRQGGAAL